MEKAPVLSNLEVLHKLSASVTESTLTALGSGIFNECIHTGFISGGWRASADNARLYFEDDQDNKRIGAWCATDRENQWLRVDLGKTRKIRAIATQGK